MATKWKYATIPADQRIEMLSQGNDELYKEELARTEDVIKSRLDAGLDVDAQMKWADTVSYNYNLGKAKNAGIDASQVHKDGYAARYFGHLTGDTYTTPQAIPKTTSKTGTTTTGTAYYEGGYSELDNNSLLKSITASYVSGINQRASILQNSYNSYIKTLNNNYDKRKAEAIKQYQENEKYYKEAALNAGRSQYGGRSLSDKMRADDDLADYLKELEVERNSALKSAKDSLMSQLYELSSGMMSEAADEYYRYNQLLQNQKDSEYEKSRDAMADYIWQSEFDLEKQNSERKNELDRQAMENDFYIQQQKLSDQKAKEQTDYEKWLREFEADNAYRNSALASENSYNASRLALEREKLEKETGDTEYSADKASDGEAEFGKRYVEHLALAKRMASAVKKTENGYTNVFSNSELIEWIYGFELTEREKKAILKELSLA